MDLIDFSYCRLIAFLSDLFCRSGSSRIVPARTSNLDTLSSMIVSMSLLFGMLFVICQLVPGQFRSPCSNEKELEIESPINRLLNLNGKYSMKCPAGDLYSQIDQLKKNPLRSRKWLWIGHYIGWWLQSPWGFKTFMSIERSLPFDV
jgi:hypothetical protein